MSSAAIVIDIDLGHRAARVVGDVNKTGVVS